MTRKKIIEATDPSLVCARQLWDRLHDNLIDTQKTLVEIIQAKAWEPLGFESFAKAWVELMSDVQIGIHLQAHVVYELLDEKIDIDEIAEMLSGVGPETVKNLAREKEIGVPPELAKGRRPNGRPRSAPTTLFLHLGKDRFASWSAHADTLERSLEDISVDVLDDYFGGLS